MARTFVRVELVNGSVVGQSPFDKAMTELGFSQTIVGRKTRKSLQLPSGMYFIKRTKPIKALDLIRRAARATNVEARIFCVPAGGRVSFGNLSFATS
jgi:hypothetical protein